MNEPIRTASVSIPEVGGILSAADIVATGLSIARTQRSDGMIPWFDGGHCDPVEPRGSGHGPVGVRALRRGGACLPLGGRPPAPDGSWFNYYLGAGVKDQRLDTNVCAYLAAGAWHHYLITGDADLLAELWPSVERGLDFVLRWQGADGVVRWSVDDTGVLEGYALLTGSSSIYHSLRCGVAIAERLGKQRPDWSSRPAGSATRSPTTAARSPRRTSSPWTGTTHALGAMEGDAGRRRISEGWSTFVMEATACAASRPATG